MKSSEFITESFDRLVSIWVRHNENGKKDKIYVFQTELGGYSYTLEKVSGGPGIRPSKTMYEPYDKVKQYLEDQGYYPQED